MIIVSNRPGQLGNLIFIYAHLLAYSLENKVKLYNPAFYSYQNYFIGSLSSLKLLNKILYQISFVFTRIIVKFKKIKLPFVDTIALDWGEELDLANLSLSNNKLYFIQGWSFRSDKLILKHKKALLDFFTPSNNYEIKINEFFKNNFSENDLKIGIHIRRGDYKTFEEGKYYYSVESYINIIKTLAVLFDGQNPRFLICSNELISLNIEELEGLKITQALGHELMDMYSLAKCNYIVGPPSTYSMWASFYGNVPLNMIKNASQKMSLADFKIKLLS